jgi:hypothetical protein
MPVRGSGGRSVRKCIAVRDYRCGVTVLRTWDCGMLVDKLLSPECYLQM